LRAYNFISFIIGRDYNLQYIQASENIFVAIY